MLCIFWDKLPMTGMLNCKELLGIVKEGFARVKGATLRAGSISLQNCLLSGYAMFSLKYPSLLQFDQHFREDIIRHNLAKVYEITDIPSDTQMRERLDVVAPGQLRTVFKRLFGQCQRSKHLELFTYYEGRYLLPVDGTGYFFRKKFIVISAVRSITKTGRQVIITRFSLLRLCTRINGLYCHLRLSQS
jgi:hypothetical protein